MAHTIEVQGHKGARKLGWWDPPTPIGLQIA